MPLRSADPNAAVRALVASSPHTICGSLSSPAVHRAACTVNTACFLCGWRRAGKWHARYARANAVRCRAGGAVCKVHNAPANLAGKTSYDGMRTQASGDHHRDALGPPAATMASLGRGRSGLSAPDPPELRGPSRASARRRGGLTNLTEV